MDFNYITLVSILGKNIFKNTYKLYPYEAYGIKSTQKYIKGFLT